MTFYGAFDTSINAWVYEHLGLGGHGSKTCSYGTVSRFLITWCPIDLVPASQLSS